jgi:hypothetical protein
MGVKQPHNCAQMKQFDSAHTHKYTKRISLFNPFVRNRQFLSQDNAIFSNRREPSLAPLFASRRDVEDICMRVHPARMLGCMCPLEGRRATSRSRPPHKMLSKYVRGKKEGSVGGLRHFYGEDPSFSARFSAYPSAQITRAHIIYMNTSPA